MERDQLIALVRKETGIKLSAADPVLAAATVNEILLENTLAKLDGSLKAAADRQAASVAQQAEASRQHVEDARQAAAALVNNSTVWVTEQLKQAGDKVIAAMLAELREETAKAKAAASTARRAAWAAAALTAAGLAGFLLAAN